MNLFDLAKINKRIEELEAKTMQEGFWSDSKGSSVVLQEMKSLKSKVTSFNAVNNEVNSLLELNDLLLIEEDIELGNDLLKNTVKLERDLSKFEIETLLSRKV